MTVGTSHDHVEWNPIAIRQYRAFQPLCAAINRTPPGNLAATRRFGETPIDRHIIQIEADHPVILIQPKLVQRLRARPTIAASR